MALDRARADAQPASDLHVGQAVSQQDEHIAFPVRQRFHAARGTVLLLRAGPPARTGRGGAASAAQHPRDDGARDTGREDGVARGGRIYLLTLSSSQADAAHAMAEFDELLSTWAWT